MKMIIFQIVLFIASVLSIDAVIHIYDSVGNRRNLLDFGGTALTIAFLFFNETSLRLLLLLYLYVFDSSTIIKHSMNLWRLIAYCWLSLFCQQPKYDILLYFEGLHLLRATSSFYLQDFRWNLVWVCISTLLVLPRSDLFSDTFWFLIGAF